MYQKYTGVILKKHPLGEADELLTIYTKEAGKLRVKAVSSRKIRSRLAGILQSLNEIDFETAGRAQAHGSGKRDGLPVLISARARGLNNYLREDLKKFAYALVGVETLYRLSFDYQENLEAYETLVRFLQELGKPGSEKLRVRGFQLNLLRNSGFRLPIDHCLNCGRELDIEANAYFVTQKGGFFCPQCSQSEKIDAPLDRESLRQLRALGTGQAANLNPQIELTIEGFLNYVLERDIRSNGFLKTLNQEI